MTTASPLSGGHFYPRRNQVDIVGDKSVHRQFLQGMPPILHNHHPFLCQVRTDPVQTPPNLRKGDEHIQLCTSTDRFRQRQFFLQDRLPQQPQDNGFPITHARRDIPNLVVQHIHPRRLVVQAIPLDKDKAETWVILHRHFLVGLDNDQESHLRQELHGDSGQQARGLFGQQVARFFGKELFQGVVLCLCDV